MIALEQRPCPVCKTTRDSAVVRESTFDPARWTDASFSSRKLPEYMHFRLLKCARCGVLYASPVPPPDVLGAAYRDATFEAGKESGYAARTYIAYLLERGVRPGRALDIGAADGAFLHELRQNGFDDVVGVEPSQAPVRAARADVRPYIRQEAFERGRFDAGSFDVVTCFQTIEHVYEPRALVEEIHRILRPGGTMFLIAHDAGALSARLLGSKSPIYDIEHVQLFDARSLRFLLAQLAFRDVRVFPILNAYPLAYWLKLFPLPLGIKLRALAALERGRLRALGARLLRVPAGNLAVFGTK